MTVTSEMIANVIAAAVLVTVLIGLLERTKSLKKDYQHCMERQSDDFIKLVGMINGVTADQEKQMKSANQQITVARTSNAATEARIAAVENKAKRLDECLDQVSAMIYKRNRV